jgi:hypothetical protein
MEKIGPSRVDNRVQGGPHFQWTPASLPALSGSRITRNAHPPLAAGLGERANGRDADGLVVKLSIRATRAEPPVSALRHACRLPQKKRRRSFRSAPLD